MDKVIKELLGSISYSDSNFEIKGGKGIHKVTLNGTDISNNIISVTIHLKPRELPRVTLEIASYKRYD